MQKNRANFFIDEEVHAGSKLTATVVEGPTVPGIDVVEEAHLLHTVQMALAFVTAVEWLQANA
jgi:hypothetical protein